MEPQQLEAWRLSVDARLAALEAAIVSLATLQGNAARTGIATALEGSVSNPALQAADPAFTEAMKQAVQSLAASLRLSDGGSDTN